MSGQPDDPTREGKMPETQSQTAEVTGEQPGAPAPAPRPAVRQGTSRAAPRRAEGYFGTIKRAAWSILEGMAVTFSYLRRPPITVQYPDRTPRPVTETLPERYRGLLEVDVLTCTGCQACERACPIGVIRIELGKEGKIRYLTRFDIDLGKCMYCGFCVEACPVDAQAPGDEETTHAIRFTREFEGVQPDLSALTYRYIQPGDMVVVAKAKKGQAMPTVARGELAREARLRAQRQNPALAARAARGAVKL
jgi:formate hydrogenlyase subunit 6/NADH:ubiquinone oxidoreductase subunit I